MAQAPGQAPVNNSPLNRRFDQLRNKVDQEANAAQQQAQEAIQRKAVQAGSSGSGAFMKLENKQNADLASQRQNALEGVEAQREQAQAAQDEANTNRQFAREERLGSQSFATSERLGSQMFASKEAAAQRGFSEKLFNKDMAFKQRVQSDQNKQFAQQFQLALDQFGLDKKVSEFNMDMAEKAFNKKTMTESLLGGGVVGDKMGGTLSRWTGGKEEGGRYIGAGI